MGCRGAPKSIQPNNFLVLSEKSKRLPWGLRHFASNIASTGKINYCNTTMQNITDCVTGGLLCISAKLSAKLSTRRAYELTTSIL